MSTSRDVGATRTRVARDIDALREVGLDDRGIHDLACVVAYFNFVNRIASGLGVPLEEPETR